MLPYHFRSKPSKKTLQLLFNNNRLIRERELLNSESQEVIPTTVFKSNDKPKRESQLVRVKELPNLEKESENNLMDELIEFRKDYLKNGGIDSNILQEVAVLEAQLQNPTRISNQLSNAVDMKQVLPPATVSLLPSSWEELQKTHEKHMLELEFEREKLIAEFELRKLKNDMYDLSVALSKQKNIVPYHAKDGFHIRWKYIEGLDNNYSEVVFSYTLFEADEPIQSLNTKHFYTHKLDFDHHFYNIEQNQSIRCILDIRLARKGHNYSVGWTSIDIFNPKGTVDSGCWKIPLYYHPIDFDEASVRQKGGNLNETTRSIYFYLFDHSQLQDYESRNPFDYQKKRTFQINPRSKYHSTVEEDYGRLKSSFTQEEVDFTLKESIASPKEIKINSERKEVLSIDTTPIMNSFKDPREAKESNNKKYEMGFHLTILKELNDVNPYTISLVVLDFNPELLRTIVFTTKPTEPSIDEGIHGWQFGFFYEIQSILGVPNRKGLFELNLGDKLIGTAEFELFKLHFSQPFDINDGPMTIQFVKNDSNVAKLLLRIYKPKFGPPSINKFIPKLLVPQIPQSAWSNTERPPITKQNFPKLFINVNGLRFLPENVTVARVVGRIYNISSKNWIKRFEISSQIGLDEPFFLPDLSASCVLDASQIQDKTCVLVLKVYTLEFFSKRLQLVGSCFINLFVKDDTPLPIEESKGKTKKPLPVTYWPNIGSFQLPLLATLIGRDELENSETLLKSNRVPCSSCLVTISGNKIESPKKYEDMIFYSSNEHLPTEYEKNLFYFVINERKPFSIRDKLLSMGDIPKTATHTEESLITWTESQLTVDSKTVITVIDRSFIAKYDPYYGFKIAIDKGYNMEFKGYSVAVLSFTPQYYLIKQERSKPVYPDEVWYTKKLDMNSDQRHPIWNDDFRWYRNRPMNHTMLAIIQIFTVSMSEADTIDMYSQGWTIFPIFQPAQYVRHGCFSLPLFDGNPNQETISAWEDNIEEADVDLLLNQNLIKYSTQKASISIRICDGRRELELPPETPSRLDYHGTTFKTKILPKQGTINAAKPKKYNIDDYQRKLNDYFVNSTNLPYIP